MNIRNLFSFCWVNKNTHKSNKIIGVENSESFLEKDILTHNIHGYNAKSAVSCKTVNNKLISSTTFSNQQTILNKINKKPNIGFIIPSIKTRKKYSHDMIVDKMNQFVKQYDTTHNDNTPTNDQKEK